MGRTAPSPLQPQRGDPVKAARAILAAVASSPPPPMLLLGSDALDAYRTVRAKEDAVVERYEELTLSTDADAMRSAPSADQL